MVDEEIEEGRRFTLTEAADLLPTVKHLTAEAVQQTEGLTRRLQALPDADPGRDRLADAFRDVVDEWASSLGALGVEVKGLWLVDFDNGEGYYCWRYPEESIGHFHGYDDGFAGRMPIV